MLAELDIIEILTEESGCEIEDIQSSIITALTDKFDIVEQEPDGNCLFRALSAGWFGSPTYFSEVRESVWDYILHNSERFKVHLPDEFDQYIETMLEDGEWGGEPEIVAFSELYNVNFFWCNDKSNALSQSWKQYLHSYNIFTVDKQQSFWFVVDKRRFRENWFQKDLIRESIRKRRLHF